MTNIVKSWGAIVLLLGSIGCGGESSTSGASAKLGAPTLSTLSVSAGVLTPDFQPDVFAYTVDLRLLQDEVEINYASDAEGADITVNNGLGVNSLTSTEVTVGLDQEVVKEITVTNDKGQSSTYKVTLQRSNSELKAIASSGAASDFYGSAVAISGNRIVVGAKYDDDLGSLSGGAFVYTLENGVWGNEQKLYAYDGAAGDEFGASVAISGDVIVVGAPKEDEKANAAGAAYMFVYENGSWGTGKKIYASDGQTNEEFGSAVAISEDKIVIGSPYNSENGAFSGAAYLYQIENGDWANEEKVTPTGATTFDIFGNAVAISGNRVVVGAVAMDGMSVGSGLAYAYKIQNGAWTNEQKIQASDGAQNDEFGVSVSISGNSLIVGAPSNDDDGSASGSAYVYTLENGTWGNEEIIHASDADAGDHFGAAVSISGDRIVIGAHSESENGSASGAVYAYQKQNSSWDHKEQKIIATDGEVSDGFGFAVSIDGDSVIVGTPGDDDKGDSSGSIYTY